MAQRGKQGAAATPAIPPNRVLPAKEKSLFNQVLKLYEDKNYRKALKTNDTILKRFPDHGETLAMRGLILNCIDRKKEAYDLVKRGLKFDLSSHICWHVYGLLYRSDREYAEAIKCYQQALKRDPKNAQIIRDLSILQVQTREYKGLLETRKQLLKEKPQNRPNWVAYIVAAHLAGELNDALRFLEQYETTPESDEQKPFDIELSEQLMYKILLLEEIGNFQKALEQLNKNEPKILDKMAVKEKRAYFLFKLGKSQESINAYRELVKANPDNQSYFEGLQRASGLEVPENERTPEIIEKVGEFFDGLLKEYPKSQAVKLIPLSILTGDRFKALLEIYLRAGLRKGIPSLFVSIKALYRSSVRTQAVEDLLVSYYDSLKATGKLPGVEEKESPLTFLWTLQFLANHFDKLGQYERALQYINEAIEHTPTALDLYLTKGRIYKHAGDRVRAAELFDTARRLDLADRYLNTKSTLYFIRADDVDVADKTIALFTRENENSTTNLVDMQCMWYELETGESYLRTKQYGMALKRFVQVEKHFGDFTEDQFDFHNYCQRKMTLRAYLRLLRFEDNLYAHKNFVRASVGIVKTYLAIYDTPKKSAQVGNDEEFAGLSEEEKKKAINKKKRQQAREQQKQVAQEEKKPAVNSKQAAKKDDDPDGAALAGVADPLGEATRYLKLALKSSPRSATLHELAVEVYVRRGKFLLALKSLKALAVLSPSSPVVHHMTTKLYSTIEKTTEGTLNAKVKEVLKLEGEGLLKEGKSSLNDFVRAYINSTSKASGEARVSAAESLLLLDSANNKKEAVELLVNLDNTTHLAATRALEILEGLGEDSTGFKENAHKLFPLTLRFIPAKPTQEPTPTEKEDAPNASS